MLAITLAYNAVSHSSTKCSPARGFLGREVDVPHVSVLPKFDNSEKNGEPCTFDTVFLTNVRDVLLAVNKEAYRPSMKLIKPEEMLMGAEVRTFFF